MKLAFMWGVYYIRKSVAEIWAWVVFRPFCLFLKSIKFLFRSNAEEKGLFKNSAYVFYTEYFFDRALLKIFRFFSKVGSWLSGVLSVRNNLGTFIISKSDQTFIGFQQTGSNLSFGLKGAKEDDGARSVDLMWTIYLQPKGRFSVVDLDTTSNKSFKAKCVWVSGEYSGKVFTLGDILTMDDLEDERDSKHTPSNFFEQPVLHDVIGNVFAFIGVTSVASFLDFLPKLKEFYQYIKTLLG